MGSVFCHKCGLETVFTENVGRRDECGKCHADLHVCKNCVHYDARVYNECKETSAEVVREKDRSNFCDYFLPGRPGAEQDRQKDLRAAAEALFKKKT